MAKDKIADISKWQGTIDFAKAKDELQLVIIRVQDGSTYEDPLHKYDEAHCINYGIPFGEYAFAEFVSVNDAKVEARDFLNRSSKDAKFLVLDLEKVTVHDTSQLVPATQAFIDYLHENGVEKVGLYTGNSFYKEHGLDKVKCDFLWIARYSAHDDGTLNHVVYPDMACDMFQYSSKGHINGISGNVDLDMIMHGKPLSYFTNSTPKPKPAPASKPIPQPVPQPVAPKPAPVTSVDGLKKGDKGDSVKELQTMLSKIGFDIAIDGEFSQETEDDVRDFQKEHGLKDDGIAGKDMMAILNGLYDAKVAEDKVASANDAEAIAKAKAEEETKLKAEQEAKAKADAEAKAKAKAIAEAKAKAEEEAKAKAIAEAKAKAKAESESNSYKTHTVVSGDTLSELAVKYDTTVIELKKLNGLSSDVIKIGQVLKVGNAPTTNTTSYKVESGDNLTYIAHKFNTTIDAIVKINGLKNASFISIGQVLQIPAPHKADNVYGTLTVEVSSLNVHASADFNSKIVKVINKGEAYKVYGQKNGLYNIGGNQYCSAGSKYVKFVKNPNYGK